MKADDFLDEGVKEAVPDRSELEFAVNRALTGLTGTAGIPSALLPAAFPPAMLFKSPAEAAAGATQNIREAIGLEPMEARTPGERLRGEFYEFAGAGAPFSLGNLSRVPTLARKAGTLARDVATAGGASLGSVLGEDVGGPLGKLIGAILGGAYPALQGAILQGGIGVLKAGGQALSGQAKKELMAALSKHPDVANQISESGVIERFIGATGGKPFHPRLSQITGSPGVASIEQRIIGRSPASVEKAAAVEADNLAAIASSEQKAIGAELSPSAMLRPVTAQLRKIQRGLENKLKLIDNRIEGVKQRIAGRGQQEVGDELYALYEQRLQSSRQVRDAKYAEVYDVADRLGFTTKMDDVVSELSSVKNAPENWAQRIPPEYSAAISRWTSKSPEPVVKELPRGKMTLRGKPAPPREATFEEIHSLWKQTNRDYELALRSGDPFSIQFLGELKSALKGKLNQVEQGGFGELTTKFKEANQWFQTDYARNFREGVGGKMGAPLRFDERIKPEALTRQFFTPSGADDFYSLFAGKPEQAKAMTALRDGVLDLYSRSGQSADAFIRRNAETLRKFPDIAKTLRSETDLIKALGEKSQRMVERQTAIDKSMLSRFSGQSDPEAFVRKMVDTKDRKGLLQLISSSSKPVRQSVARLVSKSIPEAAAKENQTALEFLMRNEGVFKPVMNQVSPQHFENLRLITAAKSLMSRGAPVPRTGSFAGRLDPLEQAIGTSTQSLLNMLRVVTVTRAAGEHGMATVLFGKFMNKLRGEKADKLLEAAIYDPELAKALRDSISPSAGPRISEALTRRASELGIKATAASIDEFLGEP